MRKALSTLMNIQDAANTQLRESSMACKCKEPKIKDASIPCSDPNEESFRLAYLNSSKKVTKLSAEKSDLELQNKLIRNLLVETQRKLELHIQGIEHYAKNAIEELSSDKRIEFVRKHGVMPTSLKLRN